MLDGDKQDEGDNAMLINRSEEKKESESSALKLAEGQASEDTSPIKADSELNVDGGDKKDEQPAGDAAIKKDKPSMTKQQRIQAFFESRKIYPTLQGHQDIKIDDDDLGEFYEFQKHFMIMTEAGKPIYSRFGDEEILSPVFATISAIIHKI